MNNVDTFIVEIGNQTGWMVDEIQLRTIISGGSHRFTHSNQETGNIY